MEIALENLKLTLTSPWERAPGTIKTYLETGKRFLDWLGNKEPAEISFRQYFSYRRDNKISERTLCKEFYHLKKLAEANGWEWTFTADDVPFPEEEPSAPALAPEVVERLINAQHLYLKSDRFYLAVSTTWGCRREELARIRKRDYDAETILIRTAQKGRWVRHLIPDVLKPIFETYHPKQHTPTALSIMFHRICRAADIEVEKGSSFHSIRRNLRTILEWNLAEERLPLSLVADYFGWSKKTKGLTYGGSAMLDVYDHPEILPSDKFAIDMLIYKCHPYLKFWGGGTASPLKERFF